MGIEAAGADGQIDIITDTLIRALSSKNLPHAHISRTGRLITSGPHWAASTRNTSEVESECYVFGGLLVRPNTQHSIPQPYYHLLLPGVTAH